MRFTQVDKRDVQVLNYAITPRLPDQFSNMRRYMFALAASLMLAPISIPAAAASSAGTSHDSFVFTSPTVTSPVVAAPVTVVKQFRFLGYKVSKTTVVSEKALASSRKEIKKFQVKFGLSQSGKMNKKTVKALNKYAGNATVPKRCLTGEFTLCVNKFNKTVQAVSANGNVLKVVDARFGMPRLETREGKFKVTRKGGANHISTLYRVEMPYPLFFNGGQAVHYSHEFASLPGSLSHGCVGTRDYDAMKWMWGKSHIGTPVIVFDKAPAGKFNNPPIGDL